MSLREEQCNKVCRILDDVLANRPTERDSLIVATRRAFDALSEPHWIPVEQALPKIGEYVFCETATGCFGKYCKHHVCKFVDKDKWIDRPHFDWDRNGFPHVIAWMPLPEPFKGVTE